MKKNNVCHKELALHLCCGPCALEPVRAFAEEGYKPTLFWSNDNIWPNAEERKRRDTAVAWAKQEGYSFHKVPSVIAWEEEVAPIARKVLQDKALFLNRCRICYRQRLRSSAREAARLGFRYISTTLAVSPYQLLDVCNEELVSAANEYGLIALPRDFRPLYEVGKARSIEIGMYRQKYCGCRFSAIEAQDGRLAAQRKKARIAHENR